MRRSALPLAVVFSLLSLPVALAQEGDEDGDGITAGDKCPTLAATTVDGCPEPFRALVTVRVAYDTDNLARDPVNAGQAQCYQSGPDLCSFDVTLTLDAASAKKAGLKTRKIGHVQLTTNKFSPTYNLRYRDFKWGFSKKIKNGLKKAKKVKLTLAGTYTRGQGAPQPFEPVTFVSRHDYDRSSFPSLDTRKLQGDPSSDG